MARKRTLYTITGLKARILKLLLGTPFLVVGGLMVDAGLEGSFAILFIGALVAVVGAGAYLSAILNDEVSITMGGGGSSFE